MSEFETETPEETEYFDKMPSKDLEQDEKS